MRQHVPSRRGQEEAGRRVWDPRRHNRAISGDEAEPNTIPQIPIDCLRLDPVCRWSTTSRFHFVGRCSAKGGPRGVR